MDGNHEKPMPPGRRDDEKPSQPTRRDFLTSTADTIGALGLPAIADAGVQTKAAKGNRPNFLFLMVDEMRHPPVYESDELKTFRATYRKTQNALRATGVEFQRHCSSRSSRGRSRNCSRNSAPRSAWRRSAGRCRASRPERASRDAREAQQTRVGCVQRPTRVGSQSRSASGRSIQPVAGQSSAHACSPR